VDADTLVALAKEALVLMALASGPPLLASMGVGLVMGFVQAVTQIQESSLSSVPKLAAAVVALIISGPWVSAQLVQFTTRLLAALSGVQQ
jgi:flagellar biosynthetic protein FliQ